MGAIPGCSFDLSMGVNPETSKLRKMTTLLIHGTTCTIFGSRSEIKSIKSQVSSQFSVKNSTSESITLKSTNHRGICETANINWLSSVKYQ